jgi:hypothetical protein
VPRQAGFSARPRGRRTWRSLAAWLAGPLGILSGGVALLVLHCVDVGPRACRAPAGLVLVLVGLFEGRTVVAAWRTGAIAALSLHRRQLFWRWLVAGPVACYLGVLGLGPSTGTAYLYAASVAVWSLFAFLPLVLPAPRRAWLAELLDAHPVRKAGWCGLGLLLSFAGSESLVRIYAWAAGERLEGAYVARSRVLAPGSQFQGRLVNALGYWDDSFEPAPRAGVTRVVALGDEAVLSGSVDTNHLALVERRVPGIEVYNFGLQGAGPREYGALLGHEAGAYRPDVVLTFISVGDDVSDELPAPGVFEWQGLGLYQLGALALAPPGGVARPAWAWLSAPGPTPFEDSGRATPPFHDSGPSRLLALAPPGGDAMIPLRPEAALDREAYLRIAAAGMRVCRTPMDADMQGRWQQMLAHLEEIVAGCRQREIDLALVLVPTACQVSPSLCETLRRRAGIEPDQLDLELPQRRLTVFAADHSVPVIDLLPHLRASSVSPYERNTASWNDCGNHIAADAIGQWLQGRQGSLMAARTEQPSR